MNEPTVTDNKASKDSQKSRILLITMIAGVAIGFAAWLAASNYGWIDSLKVRFFGPPRVQLQESYANDVNGTFDHSAFHKILQMHVDVDGWVDYRAIHTDPGQLDAYLESIQHAQVDELGRDERLAFLINAYNAFTLKLIVDHFPLESIKDISSADRWDAVRWNLAGQVVSLNQIEHELVRPNFVEPRIHFALVCAAAGCPPLRNEVYTGESLERQLAEQTTYVHDHKTWFQNDESGRLGLTQLYNWYGDDFVQAAGSVVEFIQQNTSHLQDVQASSRPKINWLDYDWALNDIGNKLTR